MAEKFDTFISGVAIGGVRTKNEIRVLLCYILKSIGSEISKTGLDELIQSTQLANFFEINSALASLSENGLVDVSLHDGDDYYRLTEDGVKYADRLDTDLPVGARETAVRAALGIVAREKMRGYTDFKIEKLERGCHVILTVSDGDTVMMQTVLYAADTMQAEAVGESFLRAPEKLYSGIIDLLT